MYLEDYNYALCSDATEETVVHLFWDCQFARRCWHFIVPNKLRAISVYDEIHLSMNHLTTDITMDIVIVGCWDIWMSRNDKIFRRAAPSVDTWKHYLKGLQVTELRAKTSKPENIRIWREQNT